MPGRDPDPIIAGLAATLRDQLDDYVEELVMITQEQIPLYRNVPKEILAASLHNNTARTLDLLQFKVPLDLSTARQTGRDRAAAGIPLPELLRVYHLGFSVFWKRLVTLARAAGHRQTQAMLDAASDLWKINDEMSTAVTAAYRDEMATRMVAADRRRSALVAALLDGGIGDQQTTWEIAQTLGLPLEGSFVVVAAESTLIGDKPTIHLEDLLRRKGTASAWRSQPDREVGIIYRSHRQSLAEILQVVADATTARVGVSPEFERIDKTPRAARFARTALETLPSGSAGMNRVADTAISDLAVGNLDSTRQFVWRVLGKILSLPDSERSTYLATANAWLDADGSAALAANALYCHENTVRYRIRRLEEQLGASLSNPTRLAEIVAALQAINAFPSLAVPTE